MKNKNNKIIEKALVNVVKKINTASQKTRTHRHQAFYGSYRAVVVDTRDPRCKGRVKLFIPFLHVDITEEFLDWCEVASFFGSLEDQGSVFTPPSGSTVVVIFESGSRMNPVVIGTLWVETRGDGDEATGMTFKEEEKVWEGSPGRRVDQKNKATNQDDKYLMPPWNNESYNQKDKEKDPTKNDNYAKTYPHIYGIKTPRKHFLQFVDGDFNENFKGKRVVLQSSRGNVLYFKDDTINDVNLLYENPMWDDFRDGYPGNKYDKAKTHRLHKIELKQSGMQLQSFAGHRMILSDEVSKPIQDNKWDVPFKIEDKLLSFICLQSISEHMFWMRDNEYEPTKRSEEDGIFMVTATGHAFEMCDHTVGEKGGPERKIKIQSTSGHSIELIDEETTLYSARQSVLQKEGKLEFKKGIWANDATKGKLKIRSGWGQLFLMDDEGSQQENASQYILIANYNKDKPEPGEVCGEEGGDLLPFNAIRMSCVNNDKQFYIWGAGTFSLGVKRDYVTVVYNGHSIETISKGSKAIKVCNHMFYCAAQKGAIIASEEGQIFLLTGKMGEEGSPPEKPPRQIAIFQGFTCPFTKHVHHDELAPDVWASGPPAE